MKAIIYGTGNFSEFVAYLLKNDSEYEVTAFCVDKEFLNGSNEFYSLPLVAFETVEDVYSPAEHEMFIAVGDNNIRTQKFHQAIEKGYNLLSYISSKSITWDDLVYGKNVFVTEPTTIQPFVTIGDNNILFGPWIGHHSSIGRNNLLSCCTLAGTVTIGDNCILGLNSTIKQRVTIANNNIIGMGSIIQRDTKDSDIYRVKGSTVKSDVPSTYLKRLI